MTEKFKTDKEAKAYLKEQRAKQLKLFCPIIKDRCREDCACFSKGWTSASKSHPVAVFAYGEDCSHPFIRGSIYIDY